MDYKESTPGHISIECTPSMQNYLDVFTDQFSLDVYSNVQEKDVGGTECAKFA